jgi:hypothetical protein
MNPMLRLRHFASAPSDSAVTSVPDTMTLPEVGWSMPAIRFSSVVLPDPDGPISATNSPSGTSRLNPSRTTISWLSRW